MADLNIMLHHGVTPDRYSVTDSAALTDKGAVSGVKDLPDDNTAVDNRVASNDGVRPHHQWRAVAVDAKQGERPDRGVRANLSVGGDEARGMYHQSIPTGVPP